MKSRIFLLAALFAIILSPGAGHAASSPFVEAMGGKVRLLLSVPSHPDKVLRGAIQIDLADGWKTYWRDPGDAGVPPQIDLTGSSNVEKSEILFPAPQRFHEGRTEWAGYKRSVLLPVTFELKETNAPTRVKGHVFLGVCETICIPVQAEFDLAVIPGTSDPLAHTLVNAAFDRLPEPASPEFGIAQAQRKDGNAVFDVRLPSMDDQAQVFLASGSMAFSTPAYKGDSFSAKILRGASDRPARIDYTLVQGDRSVSGTVELP
ncbi:protein-disulfide reductase DsbD domain-containing protein [Phyllobacterium leguminum]|uniref:DsbC/DsbD-like thiol-disulfide interchange protein n=1 Tax=Phyllobacterium leguminum TaxID=314237 RepID=A0A318T7P6_9HYPH|nr:protein-disulfide reductase DsbD domain-containing protein [Phyllobacterium leguminum]PYE90611.1 DsbC/DsbD-like thiol-disulfide interchange protein [Phyllobacterium leguminum]